MLAHDALQLAQLVWHVLRPKQLGVRRGEGQPLRVGHPQQGTSRRTQLLRGSHPENRAGGIHEGVKVREYMLPGDKIGGLNDESRKPSSVSRIDGTGRFRPCPHLLFVSHGVLLAAVTT